MRPEEVDLALLAQVPDSNLPALPGAEQLQVLRREQQRRGARLMEGEGLHVGSLLRRQGVPQRHVLAGGVVAGRADKGGAAALNFGHVYSSIPVYPFRNFQNLTWNTKSLVCLLWHFRVWKAERVQYGR